MYKSPIEKIYGELQTQIVQEDENMVMKAIRNVGLTVDKEELIRALQYERNQYAKGYEDGKNAVLDKIKAEIEEERVHDDWDFGQENYYNNAIDDVLRIIDKYKAKSEKYVNFADDLIPIMNEVESEDEKT